MPPEEASTIVPAIIVAIRGMPVSSSTHKFCFARIACDLVACGTAQDAYFVSCRCRTHSRVVCEVQTRLAESMPFPCGICVTIFDTEHVAFSFVATAMLPTSIPVPEALTCWSILAFFSALWDRPATIVVALDRLNVTNMPGFVVLVALAIRILQRVVGSRWRACRGAVPRANAVPPTVRVRSTWERLALVSACVFATTFAPRRSLTVELWASIQVAPRIVPIRRGRSATYGRIELVDPVTVAVSAVLAFGFAACLLVEARNLVCCVASPRERIDVDGLDVGATVTLVSAIIPIEAFSTRASTALLEEWGEERFTSRLGVLPRVSRVVS